MSDDLISRQAAIDALEKVAELYPWRVPGNRDSYSKYNEAWNDALDRAESEIEALPSAQPERQEGRWLNHLGLPLNNFCSICAKDSPCNKHWNFCPNCGADMRGNNAPLADDDSIYG